VTSGVGGGSVVVHLFPFSLSLILESPLDPIFLFLFFRFLLAFSIRMHCSKPQHNSFVSYLKLITPLPLSFSLLSRSNVCLSLISSPDLVPEDQSKCIHPHSWNPFGPTPLWISTNQLSLSHPSLTILSHDSPSLGIEDDWSALL
jgi:hypothetical protein